jgi:hypothetical protein
MARTRTRWTALLGAIAVAASLAGCGVTLQDAAVPLPSNALPAPLRIPTPAPPPSPSTSPSIEPSASTTATASRLRVWFVQDDGLAAVESSLPVGSSPDLVLQSLAVGPTAAEAGQGLRTVARDPLTGLALVFVSATQPSPSAASPEVTTNAATGPPQVMPSETAASVTVTLSPAFGALPPSEQVLLLGQVVLSLAGAGEQSIAFVDDSGSPVAVPLPDGRLLDTPATARDYAGLIVRP